MSSVRGRRPGQVGEIAFALQHGKVKADRVPDHHGLAEIRFEARPGLRKQRRFRDHGVVDAMNARRLGGDRFTSRPQQLAEFFVGNQLSNREPHRGKLDHPRLAWIEPGGFGVDDDGVERQKRSPATRPVHRPSLPAACDQSKGYAAAPVVNARSHAALSMREINSSWILQRLTRR